MKKPNFTVDQVTAASMASRRFGDIRKRAKEKPQFISDNNNIETVVLDYHSYEAMYMELEALKEMLWENEIEKRVIEANTHPEQSVSLKQVMGDEQFSKFRSIDPEQIADDDLFENE